MFSGNFFRKSSSFVFSFAALFFTVFCSFLQAATGNIAGEVEDAFSSSPVPNATIVVLLNNVQVATTTTDINGNYTVANLDTGSYTVRASATNYQTAIQGVTVQANVTTPADFILQPDPGNLTGHVINASTIAPIPGATINVFQNNILIATTTTDGSGGYTILGLPEGSYSVTASHINFGTVVLGVSILPNQTSLLNFFLPVQSSTIAGQVTLANTATPVVGAVVNVFQGAILVNFSVSDSNGNYSISGIQPGSYSVRASALNLQTDVQGAVVQAGLTTTINFGLFPAESAIAGQVSNITTGLPIAGVIIEVTQNNVPIGSAITNVNGTYTVPSLFPGNFIVVAHIINYQTETKAATVQFSQTTPVDFTLTADPGALMGQVVDASNGNPIAGAVVEVLNGAIIVATGVTDNNGNYVILSLAPPGDYIVRASATNYQTAVQGAVIVSNQTTTANFALQPMPGRISGTVIDAVTSAVIPGATINILQGIQLIATTLTDAAGNYLVSNLAPGTYTTNASAPNYGTVIQGAIVQSNVTTIDNFALQPMSGQISGNVIDAVTSAVIPGATINILQGVQLIATTLTDAAGNYTVSNLVPGIYTTNASAPNYATVIQGAIVQSNVTTIDNFVLTPTPGVIAGQVIDATTSAPIAGATVNILQGLQLIASTVTDASGNYIVPNIAPGTYITNASAPNYGTVVQGAIVQSNQTTINNFALQQSPGHIAGQVIDANTSAPIPGATVQVLQGIQLIASTLTDAAGNYLVPNLAPGTYSTNASATNYGTVVQGAIVQSNQTTIDNFALHQNPGQISGQVIDAVTSAPIAGATVNVLQGIQLIASTLTDASGNYLVSNLAPATYATNASAPNYGTIIQGAIVLPNTTTVDNFALQPNSGSISGQVTDATTGAFIPGATINIFQGVQLVASTLTDASGNYLVPNLAPGIYVANASALNYGTVIQGAVVQSGLNTFANFALPSEPGAIVGHVTDIATTAPIPGTTIDVLFGGVLVSSVLTDSNGDYSIPGLSQGNYSVRAAAFGYQTALQLAAVTSNQTTIVNFDLQNQPGGIIGNVTDQTLLPIVGATVDVFQGDLLIASTLTDSNGNYVIPSLGPGDYSVIASAPGFQLLVHPATVQANHPTVVDFILLTGPGTLVGHVYDIETNLPVVGAIVNVYDGAGLVAASLTDNSGAYSIPSLAPGSYSVSAAGFKYHIIFQTANIFANQTSVLDFYLLDPPTPPLDVVGQVLCVSFLTQTDWIHRLEWLPSTSIGVVYYLVLQDGVLIATIPSDQPLSIVLHNQRAYISVTYTIIAVNSLGEQSQGATIIL